MSMCLLHLLHRAHQDVLKLDWLVSRCKFLNAFLYFCFVITWIICCMCTFKSEKQRRTNFIEMSSEAQETLPELDLKYGDPTAAEISELKTDLEDFTHRHNRSSRVMKISLFANIVLGIICVVLLSLFLCEIMEERNSDHGKTSSESKKTFPFMQFQCNLIYIQLWLWARRMV